MIRFDTQIYETKTNLQEEMIRLDTIRDESDTKAARARARTRARTRTRTRTRAGVGAGWCFLELPCKYEKESDGENGREDQLVMTGEPVG